MEKLLHSEIGSNPRLYLDQLIEHYADGNARQPLRLVPEITEELKADINKAEVEIEADIELISRGSKVLKVIGRNACFGHPKPEIFFPEPTKNMSLVEMNALKNDTEAAKLICANCIEKSNCLDGALKREERFGIWGGLTVKERNKLLDRKARSRVI